MNDWSIADSCLDLTDIHVVNQSSDISQVDRDPEATINVPIGLTTQEQFGHVNPIYQSSDISQIP